MSQLFHQISMAVIAIDTIRLMSQGSALNNPAKPTSEPIEGKESTAATQEES